MFAGWALSRLERRNLRYRPWLYLRPGFAWRFVRARLFWWCARPGCWRESCVLENHRGNVCAVCLMELIMRED